MKVGNSPFKKLLLVPRIGQNGVLDMETATSDALALSLFELRQLWNLFLDRLALLYNNYKKLWKAFKNSRLQTVTNHTNAEFLTIE